MGTTAPYLAPSDHVPQRRFTSKPLLQCRFPSDMLHQSSSSVTERDDQIRFSTSRDLEITKMPTIPVGAFSRQAHLQQKLFPNRKNLSKYDFKPSEIPQ